MREYTKKAALLRKLCLVTTSAAGSGHPTSCMSCADLVAVLFDRFFRYDIASPDDANNDRFILSKGHVAPLLYAAYALSGAFPVEDLTTLRTISSPLEGHPTPEFRYAEAATGSLGQGLSVGAGMALFAKKQILPYKTFVLLGDGEMAEGRIWATCNFAAYYALDNLIAMIDVNRLGQSQETMFGHRIEEHVQRISSFGWEVVAIDGHNVEEIERAFSLAIANKSKKPFAIVAKTKKGKGVPFLEDKEGWHGKALKQEELVKALEELGEVDEKLRFVLASSATLIRGPVSSESIAGPATLLRGPVSRFPPVFAKASAGRPASAALPLEAKRGGVGSPSTTATPPSRLPRSAGSPVSPTPPSRFRYRLGEEIATREVYGEVLAQIADKNPLIYALDGDVKNSTFSQDFKKEFPDRFIECFIAEQNMVGVGLGFAKRGAIPFISSFAAFLTRAFDQIRMASLSKADIKFVGSHAGVSIGEDGPSQMGLEDIAMFRTIPHSVVVHPCDVVSTAKLLPLIASHRGISYLRTLRPKTPVLYSENDTFEIGGSKVLKKSSSDILTVVACGITVFEALKAHEILKKKTILIRVVDLYSIKPLDKKTLKDCLKETKENRIITVEDHFIDGGMGDAVAAFASEHGGRVHKMGVKEISHSGIKDELLRRAEIDADSIVSTVLSLVDPSTVAQG